MRLRILVAVLVAVLACPVPSHAFGLLRYCFDAIANQLGLDRGPVPKKTPGNDPFSAGQSKHPAVRYPDPGKIHIQAEGF